MTHVIQLHMLHADNFHPFDQSSLQPENEDAMCALLNKDLEDKTQQLSRLNGEELDAMSFEELVRLERQADKGQTKIRRAKGEKLRKELATLKGKDVQLSRENQRLKEKMKDVNSERVALLQLAKDHTDIPSSTHVQQLRVQENISSDTFLRLGPPI